MSDQQQGADEDEVIKVDQTDKRSMVPFIAAAVLAAIVLGAIVLGGLLSPAEKNVTEADRIAAAVRNYADARGRTDTVPPPGVACEGFNEGTSPLGAQIGAPETRTSIEVTEIVDPMVNGDKAKATVTTKVAGREATATWNLTRSGDKWLVCT